MNSRAFRLTLALGAAALGCASSSAKPAAPAGGSTGGFDGHARPLPLGPNEVSCKSSSDCPRGEQCEVPESHNHNLCGHPRPPSCGPGETGDDCGSCYRTCSATRPCPSEYAGCDGSMCVSAARCYGPKPRLP